MRNFLLIFIFTTGFLVSNNIFSQEIQLDNFSSIDIILEDRGVDKNQLIARLNEIGLDIENMTESEIIENRDIIEDLIEEIQQELIVQEDVNLNALEMEPLNENDQFEIISKNNNEVIVEKVNDSDVEQKNSNIYGHNIFSDKSTDVYRISKDASPPDTYILAAGDKINILIFGKSQANFVFEINEMGFIEPPKMPKIFIAGLSLKKAKEILNKFFSDYYLFEKGQFAITLNTSRTILVNVFGEVEKSGSYTTSALNTLLATLSIAGGPTDFGSVRNIEIIRGNEKRILDLYDFLSNPSSQFDFFLQNNDIIYVPPVKKLVSIEGAVNRPMSYELKNTEGISELIDFAGGLSVNAYTGLIQIETIEENKIVLKDYSLDELNSKNLKVFLKNGDKVKVTYIPNEFNNYVSIEGSVYYDGSFPINTTQSLKVLLDKAQLKPEAKTDLIFIIRKKLDDSEEIISVNINNTFEDIKLIQKDKVVIYSKSDYVNEFNVKVSGEVRDPIEINLGYGNKISINEAVNISKGFTNEAADFGYIYRTDPFDNNKIEYIPVDFKLNFNSQLLPGDILVVLNKNNYSLQSSIEITGDVKTQTTLLYDESLTIKDLINIAEGINMSSDLNNIDIFRLNFEDFKSPKKSTINLKLDKDFNIIGNSDFRLMPYDIVVVRTITNFKPQEIVTVSGEVNKAGPYVIENSNYRFTDLLNSANGITDDASIDNIKLIRSDDNGSVITFNPRKAINNPKSRHDPILKGNDQIIIPENNNIVSILKKGTNHPLHDFGEQDFLQIVYAGKHSAKWYINNFAGGFSKNSDKSSTSVVKVNGKIKNSRKVLFLFRKYPTVQPGDKISVLISEEKVKKDERVRAPFNWDSFTSKIISFATVYTLLKQTINQ